MRFRALLWWWQSTQIGVAGLPTLSLVAMHGCRLSISSLHLGCRESLLLSLLDHFVSLLLSVPCHSVLSCLASGVCMTCSMPCNSSPLLATMALMPTQLIYTSFPSCCWWVGQVQSWRYSWSSLSWAWSFLSVRSILSSGVGTWCLSWCGNRKLTWPTAPVRLPCTSSAEGCAEPEGEWC